MTNQNHGKVQEIGKKKISDPNGEAENFTISLDDKKGKELKKEFAKAEKASTSFSSFAKKL